MTALNGERPRRSSRRTLLVAAGLAISASLALTACADGQKAQTAVETPAVDGVAATVATMAVRNFALAPSNFGTQYTSAQLQGVLINNGNTEDQLIGVTTAAAKSVSLFANSALATPPTPSPTASAASTSSSASGSASSSASASASATPTPQTYGALIIPPGGFLQVGPSFANGAVIQLNDLTRPLQSSSLITVAFTFKIAGTVTLTMAVALSTASVPPSILPTTVPSNSD